jgi:hypothetical protein
MSMSSSQLRENLTLLGQVSALHYIYQEPRRPIHFYSLLVNQSTSSEGLSGEERRQELARRLMDALARPDLPPGFVSAMRRRIAEDAEVDDPATKVISIANTVSLPSALSCTVDFSGRPN